MLVGAALCAAPAVQAFMPANQNEDYEILLPRFNHLVHESFDRDMGVARVSEALSARYGGSWQVHSWNAQTGTARFVYGSGPALGLSVRSELELEAQARQVIADNPELFRADPQDLRLHATPYAMGKWVAHFQQTYHGVDVEGGRVLVSLSDDGRRARSLWEC